MWSLLQQVGPVLIGLVIVAAVACLAGTCWAQGQGREIRTSRAESPRCIVVDMGIVRQIESGGNPQRISPCGARGPYQMMRPAWHDAVRRMRELEMVDDADDLSFDRWVEDETVSRAVAMAYLTDVLPGYLTAERLYDGDTTDPVPDSLEARLAAYNCGARRVRLAFAKSAANWQTHLPAETREYLSRYARAAREKRDRAAAASDAGK